MPRFLNTWTGEFEWHDDLGHVRYAILSHVWRTPEEGGEQTFDDVRRIQEHMKEAQGDPYPVEFDTADAPFPRDVDAIFSDAWDGVGEIFSLESPLSDKIKCLCKVARGVVYISTLITASAASPRMSTPLLKMSLVRTHVNRTLSIFSFIVGG